MAKRKNTKKARNQKAYSLYPRIIFSLLLVFLLYSFINLSAAVRLSTGYKNFTNKDISPVVASQSAVKITPYPTLSPKPTQMVLSGFCLKVPVLMYHHIQPEADAQTKGQTALTVDNQIFTAQMQYLSQNGYTPIWASDLSNSLINKTPLSGKPIVITMDDGYEDNFLYALPVFKQYGFKANVMLATGLMGNKDMLSWDQVKALKDSGLIYFTNHTWSHYAVNRGPQSTIEAEIDTGANQIQSYTGQFVDMFTYPYGAYNDNAIATLVKKGYKGAFSEIPGQYQCDSFLMTLHRTRIGNGSLASYGL